MPAGDERIDQRNGDLSVFAIEFFEIAKSLEQRDVLNRLSGERLFFLSSDPVGYIDSSNLYSYCGGDPINHRDPRGEYEADVHYRLTRYLGEQAGFVSIDGEIIANEDVGVDLHESTGPTANAAKGNWGPVYEFHFPVASSGRVEEGISAVANPTAWGKANAARGGKRLQAGCGSMLIRLWRTGGPV